METINIRLAAFEGPLDLLYHLIEKNEIDIYDIPIAALTEQYLAYLDAAEDRDMDGMSEFLLMAATQAAPAQAEGRGGGRPRSQRGAGTASAGI